MYPPLHHPFGELQSVTHILPVNTLSNSFTPQTLRGGCEKVSISEVLLNGDEDIGTSRLSINLQGSEGQKQSTLLTVTASALSTFASPNLNDLISAQVSLCNSYSHCSGTPPSMQAEATDMPFTALESPSHSTIQEESFSKGPGGCSGRHTKVGDFSLALLFYEDNLNTSLNTLATMSLKDTTSEINSDATGPFSSPEDSNEKSFSEETWDSLHSHGNLSVVEEENSCDTLQMSLPGPLTLLSEEVCTQTETETHRLVQSLHDFPTENEVEGPRKVQQTDMNVSKTPKHLLCYPSKDLIEIDSLESVFQTNDPEFESENVDAFFQDVGVEGLVYWAEPIKVLSPNPMHECLQSREVFDGIFGNEPVDPSTGRLVPSSLSSVPSAETNHTPANDAPSSLTSPPFLFSTHDPSLQMSLPPTSHIVHRKDIPYVTNSQCTHLPSVVHLDTSTPFRAVQSWTDLQIKRNILSNAFKQRLFHTIPKKVTTSQSAPETTQNHKVAQNGFTGMARNNYSMSDPGIKGLWPDEEVDTPGSKGENQDQRLMTCHCACCGRTQDSYNMQHTLGKSPVSNCKDAALIFTTSVNQTTSKTSSRR